MIEVKNLNKTYDRRRRTANRVLKDISLTLPDKGFVCILGPSGCGKTSLLNAVGGLDVFDNGTLSVGDQSFTRSGSRAFEAERNRNFGYIFQNYYLLENHSVAYNVYLGLHSLKLSHREKIERIRKALRAVDMERYIRRKVGELSGGQQQRVAIARALARRPRVIFADEPTGNLDEGNTRNICSLLRQASKESLVIMVTHEERIARFFADRIIRLDNGVISQDSDSWQRDSLAAAADTTVYTDGLEDSRIEDGGMTLRLLREEGAAPVELTVAVLKDRIVLKLSDTRAVDLGSEDEAPRLVEGKRPDITLDELESAENEAQAALFASKDAKQTKAGSGVTLPMLINEARHLTKEKNLRRAGMKVFLILLTVLTLLTVGDFVALSRIDPEDFITTDSHLLTLSIEQGEEIGTVENSINNRMSAFVRSIYESGLDFDFVPDTNARLRYSATVFPQLGSVSIRLPATFSYVPSTRLDESTLIYGRAPENSQEIVADRQVLEATLEESDGIVQNTIVDLSYFLGAELNIESRNYTLTVVGICDSGERSLYVSKSALLTLRNGSIKVIGMDEFRKHVEAGAVRYQISSTSSDGITTFTYGYLSVDDLEELADDECIINYAAAGEIYQQKVGDYYSVGSNHLKRYHIKEAIALYGSDVCAIVNDSELDELMLDGFNTRKVLLYCTDKAQMREFISKKVAEDDDKTIIVRLSDPYQQQYNSYAAAARIRADARSIITATVLVVCLVMLYLLCRTQAQERIELLAVYRLLGIPRRKLHGIFLIEGILSALTAIIPSAFITWAVVAFIKARTEIPLSIVLPWQAVAITGLCILCYYLLTSVLPLFKLLRLPPAQLAAKYDM